MSMLRWNRLLITLLAAACLLLVAGSASAAGGPDGKGYRWDTSGDPYVTVIPDTPDPTNTLRLAQDQDSGAIDIAYLGFEYYDVTVTRVYVNNNGLLSFGGVSSSKAGAPHLLPDAAQLPANVVAGCWVPFMGDEVSSPSPNPGLLYYDDSDPDKFVAEWKNYQHASGTGQATFQIVLHKDGKIDVAIQSCPSPGAIKQSSGIEDNSGNHGLSYAFGTAGLGPVSVRYHPNNAPVGTDDLDLAAYVTDEDTSIDLDVLANDSDPDGDALTITDVTIGSHGSVVTLDGGKKLRYTPDADSNDAFRGGARDAFTYTVSDPYGKSATVDVNVSVRPINDPPEFVLLGDITTDEDQDKTVTGWLTNVRPGPVTATDEADQELTISLERLGGDADLLDATPVLGDGPSHSLKIEPAAHQNGFQTWTLNVSEGPDLLHTETNFLITVEAVNDPPTFEAVGSGVEDPVLGPVRDPMVAEGSGPHVFSGEEPWAREPSPGPAEATDEAGQGTYYLVEAENPSLFSKQPAVDAEGRLTFRIKEYVHGSSEINVTIWDDAGTPGDTSDDKQGAWRLGTITAWPVNNPPTANDDALVYLIGQGDALVDVVANDDDHPDQGETLRLAAGTAAIVSSSNAAAEVERVDDNRIRFNLTTGQAGVEEIKYRVVDDGVTSDQGAPAAFDPKSAVGTLRIVLTTLEHVGVFDTYNVVEDGRLELDAQSGVAANDFAPVGLERTVTVAEAPRAGTLTLFSDGGFHYEPQPDFSGIDSFSYYLTIGNAGRSPPIPVEIVVRAVNDKPVAFLDSYVFAPDETAIVPVPGVLRNDKDADGDIMTVRLVQRADHGTVELREDGSFKYIPKPGFTGLDIFRYEVRDLSGWGTSTEVHIHVRENKAPYADFKTDRTTTAVGHDPTNPNDPAAVRFSDLSVDPDGDIRRWLWDFGNGDTRADQHVTYVFTSAGEYRIRLTVWDEAGASSTVQKEFIVTNLFNEEDGGAYGGAPPVAHAGPDRIVLQDTRVQLGCRITATLSCGDNFAPTILGHHWEQVAGPTVSLSSKDAQFPGFQAPQVPVDGQVTLTFRLTIFDGQHVSQPSYVNITVQDRILRPIANAGNNLTVLAGQVVNLHGQAVGFDEGVPLTYTWRQVDDGCGKTCPEVTGVFHGQDFGFRAPDISGLLADLSGVDAIPVRFALTVSDGIRTTAPDEVVVTIRQVPQIAGFQHKTGIGADSLIVQFAPRQVEVPRLVASHWDFGDNTTSDQLRPVHGYAAPGTYTVVWTLTLSDGRIQTFEKTIEVGQEAFADLELPSKAPVGMLATVTLVGALAGGGVYAFVRVRGTRADRE